MMKFIGKSSSRPSGAVGSELRGWIAEHEGAKFAGSGTYSVKDVFVFCIGGLTGFPEAIQGVFPKEDIQLCMVHMMRNSLRYVSYNDEIGRASCRERV